MAKDKEKKEKEKEHKHQHEILKSGDKYHCGECGAEVDFGENCPSCKVGFDWTMVAGQVRRL